MQNRIGAEEQLRRYLGNRDYFELELKRKLEKKGYEADEIEPAIQELKRIGYIDDKRISARFAEIYLEKEGSLKVKSRLCEKGIPSELAKYTIEDAYATLGLDEQTVCNRVLLSKMNTIGIQKPLDSREYAKMARFLKNKGFGDGVVINALAPECI